MFLFFGFFLLFGWCVVCAFESLHSGEHSWYVWHTSISTSFSAVAAFAHLQTKPLRQAHLYVWLTFVIFPSHSFFSTFFFSNNYCFGFVHYNDVDNLDGAERELDSRYSFQWESLSLLSHMDSELRRKKSFVFSKNIYSSLSTQLSRDLSAMKLTRLSTGKIWCDVMYVSSHRNRLKLVICWKSSGKRKGLKWIKVSTSDAGCKHENISEYQCNQWIGKRVNLNCKTRRIYEKRRSEMSSVR